MRALFAAVLLSISSSALAFQTWFEPATPDSHSFVKVQARSHATCIQWVAGVTRSGNVIDVAWKRFPACSGITVPPPWSGEAAIGMLEPGVYEVRLSTEAAGSHLRTLVIPDAAPSLHVEPRAVSVTGGETIVIVRDEFGECHVASEVMVGGAPATIVEADCSYATVVVPPHAAGAVDVSARYADGMRSTRAALQYVDPAAQPDDSLFERMLVPLIYDGAGAYGSQWITEGKIYPIDSSRPLRWMHDVVNAECASATCSGDVVDLTSFGNHAAGLLLFVPRDHRHVEAKLFVRDTSRDTASWGAQVPIVREKDFVRDAPLVFPNLPFDSPHRALLRIYGVDGIASHVRVSAGDQSRIVTLTGACGLDAASCNTARPAFAAIDLQQAFPELAGHGRFTVSVWPHSGTAQRFWAFVSVTNNGTQNVTVVTP